MFFNPYSPTILKNTSSVTTTAANHAEEVGRTTRPGGVIANLQMRIGTVTLMISEANDRFAAMPASYYIYVEDADATMARAIAAGASTELEVTEMHYDDRQGGVRDPFGNLWWISQRLVDRPYH